MNNSLKSENHRKMIRWTASSTGILVAYGGLLLLEAFFYSGDMRVALLSILAGAPLVGIVIFVYSFFSEARYMPFYIGILAHFVFLGAGTYLKELDFYFFVMFLVVGTITTMKNFKMMSIFVSSSIFINIIALIFLLPHLDWLNDFRFFMQFVMYLYGSVFMLIQTYNVTQKENRSEKALAAFSSLLRSTPNLMAITDADSKVMYLSDQIAKFIQCPRKEFAVGQPLIDLIADKELKFMFANMLDTDGFFETLVDFNIDGEQRHFKIIADKLSGEAEGVFIDIADVTPTVKSQKAALEAQTAAEEANKSKSNFLAAMSHEIRTPMNAIIGISQIQLQQDDLPKDYASALHKIYSSGISLLGIINDILDLSKIETGKLELNPVDYDTPSLINDAVQLNMVKIGSKQLEFLLDVDENLPSRLFGDELRLKQVLNNLLSNGIKYSEKGYVKLSVSHSIQDGDIMLRFVVEDTGQGLKPDDLERLFSEYSRFNIEANRATEGAGLGLNITQKLIEMMEGTIHVESEYGRGSKFTVEVKQKAVECEIIGAELSKRLRSFTFTGDKHDERLRINRVLMPYGKVLIVDDMAANLFVSEGLMRPYGLTIETTSSGYDALEKIRGGSSYDIVFMDHMMPGMDGIETTKRIRDTGYTLPIVALTANAVSGQSDMFLENGFDGFISKPIDIRELDAVLHKQIRDKQPPEVIEESRPDVFASLKSINGLDVDAAIEGMGGMFDMYMDTVRLTVRLMPETSARLDKHFTEGDIKAFTIEVHGVKSVLKNIGAAALGNDAALLERAALENDWEYCTSSYPAFKASMVILEENLNAALAEGNVGAGKKETGDQTALMQVAAKAKVAAESYDSDMALEIIAPHTEFTYDAAADDLLKEIILSLESFDCESAVNYIKKLEEYLHGLYN